MIINLKDYIGKKVEVELRNGNVYSGHKVWEDLVYSGPIYKYLIDPLSCRYDRYGNYSKLCNDQDIIKIKEIKEPPQPTMTYEISKQIRIHHQEDDWDYVFTTDEYGTVKVAYNENLRVVPHNTSIHIHKDCIQNFIDVLEQFK